MPKQKLPKTAEHVAERHAEVWNAYAKFGKTLADAGPLDERARRLVKLGVAIGVGSEGAVHSHARRALQEGFSAEEIEHAAVLAMTTLGFPRAVAALTWVEDVTRSD